MYCEWCGHQYQKTDKYQVHKCIPCAARYNRYSTAKKLYRHNPTIKNLNKLEAIQKEYKEMALQGFKVPEDIENILKGGTV